MTNRLSGSNSPYLLQHAENPVDWFPWGQPALRRARDENKPIFLSIGYAACHWCHVMAHESFEDPSTAALLNSSFVSIKVDREERPDLDAIYMQATTSLTGSGGWPMSVFLTPTLEPFYAGTYFPPTRRYGMPSFREVLEAVAKIWVESPDQIAQQGAKLLANMRSGSTFPNDGLLTTKGLDEAAVGLVQSQDRQHGGWGTAPKFPQPMALEFLLRRSARDDSRQTELETAVRALQAMSRGGMYDVVGGGFARYSTDASWHIPHFEKMLYDNAQLAITYLRASQLTGSPTLRRTFESTLAFIEREMMGPEGGFHSSIDADSEGVEGKFYTWTKTELEAALDDATLRQIIEAAYHPTESPNGEGRIVLQRALDDATLAARLKLSMDGLHAALHDGHTRLLRYRSKRIRPSTDDKILASWNALALSAFSQAAIVGEEADARKHYLDVATRNAAFLLEALAPDGHLAHAWRHGSRSGNVFLEDFAALAVALIDLYQATFENRWLTAASRFAEEMLERFRDPAGGFFDTPADGEPLPLRPKDLQDNAVPCGNALACEALLRLGAVTGIGRYRDAAEDCLGQVGSLPSQHPLAFARWLNAADFAFGGARQLAILHPATASLDALLAVARSKYRPNLVVAASVYPPPEDAAGLVKERVPKGGLATAFVCRDFVCDRPVNTVEELAGLLG